MKNVAAVLAIVLFTGSSAFAGVISFGPDATIDLAAGDPTAVTFDLTVNQSDLGEFEAVDVILGSDDGLAVTDFAFATFTRFFDNSAADTSVFASGWKFGYFGPRSAPPFLLGTLSVDAAGLGAGDYFVNIDGSGRTTLALGNGTEGITGQGVVHIVPEPATLSLLALGAIGLISRRRRKA